MAEMLGKLRKYIQHVRDRAVELKNNAVRSAASALNPSRHTPIMRNTDHNNAAANDDDEDDDEEDDDDFYKKAADTADGARVGDAETVGQRNRETLHDDDDSDESDDDYGHYSADDARFGVGARVGQRNRKLFMIEEHIVDSMHGPWYAINACRDGRVTLINPFVATMFLYNPATDTTQELRLNEPWNAVQIDDTHLAVCCSTSYSITIVTIGDRLRVEKTLPTPWQPWAVVALNNGQLAIAWNGPPALGVIDVSGTHVVEKLYMDRDTNGRRLDICRFMAVDEKNQHVIQSVSTNYQNDDAVYCFDFKGSPVFRYSNPGLTGPRGVALDKYGSIYVCEYYENSIYKLSPTGDLIHGW